MTAPLSRTAPIEAAPTLSARPSRNVLARVPWRDVAGVALVVVAVLIAYSEIAFGGKTLLMNDRVQGVRGEGCVEDATSEHGSTYFALGLPECLDSGAYRHDPRMDPGAGAWQLAPWARAVHRSIDGGDAPIWNAYQGIGAPLAGNMQSAAFDPLLLPYHLDPRTGVHDLSVLFGLLLIGVATYVFARVIGLAYVPSAVAGTTFALSGWFFGYSNNDWFRTYIYLPVVLVCVEWILRSRWLLPCGALGLAVAGILVVGMPEPAFIALTASALYAAIRLWIGPRAFSRPMAVLRLGGGAIIGLCIAAPVLLLFAEYLPRSFNRHEQGSSLTDRPEALLHWLVPTVSATSGNVYEGTRNWVGAGAGALVVVALASPLTMRKHLGWVLGSVGAVVALKIYGGDLVTWTKHVPVSKLVLWPFFGTPVIAFVVAVLAAIGAQAVLDRQVDRRRLLIISGGFVVLLAVAASTTPLALRVGIEDIEPFGGWFLAAVAFLVVIATAASAPRTLAVWIVAGVVLVELVLLAPRGIYVDRANPYPQTDWVSFLQSATARDQARVFSQEGLLFPDTSSSYGLQDPRVLDAVYIDRYWRYLRRFIAPEIVDRYTADERAEVDQEIEGNRMFDLLGVKYLLTRDDAQVAPQFREVHASQGVRVYENQAAIPRAFVVHDVEEVSDQAAAIAALTRGEPVLADGRVAVTNKDPSNQAIIETEGRSDPSFPACSARRGRARFRSWSPNEVVVDVNTKCPGLLVLTDAYYPGWRATLDGEAVDIYPTDLAFRGVAVPKGRSTVEFRYAPSSFSAGLVLAVIGLATVIGLLVVDLVTLRRRRASALTANDGPPP